VSQLSLPRYLDLSWARAVLRTAALLSVFLLMVVAIHAQTSDGLLPDDQAPLVVDGLRESDVFGWGQSVVVRGRVSHGVMAFGGDVIVEGIVEGDVATIGGSVVEREGAEIGGDVIVIGGSFRRNATSEQRRNPAKVSVMFEGFQPELRNIMRHPASALAPQWSVAYLGSRVLAVLFWFIASLVLTAVTPGAISRAVTRLQLTNLRVAIIGFLGSVLMTFGDSAAAGLPVRARGDSGGDGTVGATQILPGKISLRVNRAPDRHYSMGGALISALHLAARRRGAAGGEPRPGVDGALSHRLEA
jgi:hypothetical protein